MTRKDYKVIAEAIKLGKPERPGPTPDMVAWIGASVEYSGASKQWVVMAGRIAVALAADNPRFDRERFLAACGVEP